MTCNTKLKLNFDSLLFLLLTNLLSFTLFLMDMDVCRNVSVSSECQQELPTLDDLFSHHNMVSVVWPIHYSTFLFCCFWHLFHTVFLPCFLVPSFTTWVFLVDHSPFDFSAEGEILLGEYIYNMQTVYNVLRFWLLLFTFQSYVRKMF